MFIKSDQLSSLIKVVFLFTILKIDLSVQESKRIFAFSWLKIFRKLDYFAPSSAPDAGAFMIDRGASNSIESWKFIRP